MDELATARRLCLALIVGLSPAGVVAAGVVDPGIWLVNMVNDFSNGAADLASYAEDFDAPVPVNRAIESGVEDATAATALSWQHAPGGHVLELDHVFTATDPLSAEFSREIFSFTVSADTAYVISGRNQSIGTATVDYRVTLYENTVDGGRQFTTKLFDYFAASQDTFDETFEVGRAGDGDQAGALAGLAEGTLRAGRTYEFWVTRNFARLATRPPENGGPWNGVGTSTGYTCMVFGDASCSQQTGDGQAIEPNTVPIPAAALLALCAGVAVVGFWVGRASGAT